MDYEQILLGIFGLWQSYLTYNQYAKIRLSI